MAKLPTISQISLFVAIFASFPYIVKLVLYYVWKPNIEVLYEGMLKIRNKTSRRINLKIEYRFEPHKHDIDLSKLTANPNPELMNEYGELIIESDEITIVPNGTRGLPLDLDPGNKLQVRIYPRIHLSELRCPRFYGDLELQPIDHEISVKECDGMIVGESSEVLQQNKV